MELLLRYFSKKKTQKSRTHDETRRDLVLFINKVFGDTPERAEWSEWRSGANDNKSTPYYEYGFTCNDRLDGQQSPSDVQYANIINDERNADDANSLPDSQFSLDILNSSEDNEDIQAMPPKHRILNKPSLVIQETDSDSDSSSDESSSYSSRSRSGSLSRYSSINTLHFTSDDSVKDPTYNNEDPFPGNRKAQSDADEEQQRQAQLPCIQVFLKSAVDN